ncbi:DUF3953 domain-containing protein [Bacillus hwajinpoensis]|uniref:DUF3953 domain-containing protein n=1 Tax=Guptibacillus hwajinpoensis TaxID=208199 RepID=A0A845F345_9BACL|nr:DUF3953 domain-containing protein [Pseudalkalibacillus hwajinpoensis]MYL65477.1 DUF3953 domain-containing protein [Pseudalkalibacillus hwajinpoensis]
MKLLRIICALIIGVLGGYAKVTGNHNLLPYLFIFLLLMILAMGIDELKKGNRRSSFFYFVATSAIIILLLT